MRDRVGGADLFSRHREEGLRRQGEREGVGIYGFLIGVRGFEEAW